MQTPFLRDLKLIAALLSYPTADLLAALPDLRQEARAELHPLLDHLGEGDLIDAQEAYVNLFDRTRSLTLNLFEHVHGESRDRGQAMVDLKALYADAGLDIGVHELPDWLPLFLEYLSLRDEATARAYLGEIAHIVEALHERLVKRATPYAACFARLLEMAPQVAAQPVASADRTQTAEEMDREWAEEPAFDALGNAAACAAARPAPPVQAAE